MNPPPPSPPNTPPPKTSHQPLEDYRYDSGNRRSKAAPPKTLPPKPLPKRAKGRLLIGFLLLTVFGLALNRAWNSFFRFEAYGIVSGNITQLSASVDGTVSYLHVREGDQVRQGQLLISIHRQKAEHELERLADELRMAEANLSAQVTKLRWESHTLNLESREAVADYYEAWSRYQLEAVQLSMLEARSLRLGKLKEKKAISPEQYETANAAALGQKRKVEKLKQSLNAWRERSEIAQRLIDSGEEQLRPFLTRIEVLQSDLVRLREEVQEAEILSPVNGTLINRQPLTGEFVQQGAPLASVIEENSLQIVLYVPQKASDRYEVGSTVSLTISPYPEEVVCEIQRLGEELQPAPEQISRNYRLKERLLPVYLKPVDPTITRKQLRLGSVAQVRKKWF